MARDRAYIAAMNPTWPTWLKIAYVVACTVSFAVVMWGIGVVVVDPLTEWFGAATKGWSMGANILFIVGLIGIPLWLGRLLNRRDQKREATDRLTR